MSIMKKSCKLDTCKYLGHEVNWSRTWWCNKQFDEPTEVHKKCNCKNCPDFEAYEYEVGWVGEEI